MQLEETMRVSGLSRGAGLFLVAAGLVAPAFFPAGAAAGGNEYPAAGTRSLGRGGAFYARADDPMALAYNPANLSALSSPQISLQIHQAFFDACMQRDPNTTRSGSNRFFSEFDSASDTFPGETWTLSPIPEVCQEMALGLSPNLVFTYNILPNLGVGVGLVAPAGVGILQWGNEDGTVTSNGVRVPSPTRYNLVSQTLLLVFPSVGVGYAPLPWLRVGATFHWGLGSFEYVNYTRAAPGESPDQDIRSTLSGSDFFVPGITASVHVVPHDNLDFMLGVRWIDTVRGAGEATVEWADFGESPPQMGRATPIPNSATFDAELEAPLPLQFSFGARYAHRIKPRPEDPGEVERLSGRVEDPMANEWFDVEFNAVYELNSQVDEFALNIAENSVVDLPFADERGVPTGMELDVPTRIVLPHNWKNQLSLRLGGDYNVIPGLAALRLGFSFETSGINTSLAGLDFIPSMRFGVHGGLTVRLGRFDLSIAYAHLFQSDVVITGAEARLVQIAATDPQPGAFEGSMGSVVNVGTIESNFDILSLGLTYHL